MAWKEIIEENNFWSPKEKGDEVIGTLVLVRTGQYGKLHELKLDSDEIITVPTWTILNNKLNKIKTGQKVKIVYIGDIKTPNGNAKDFAVYVKE